MARAKRQDFPSTQALNQPMQSSIGNFQQELYPDVRVRLMAGRRMPRLMPNPMGGFNVATRPDPNAGLPDIAENPGMGESGFLMSRQLSDPSWGKFFDTLRAKGAVVGRDRRPGADLFSGPATSFEEMRPGQYLTKTAADWSKPGRGQSGSNMASSMRSLENTLYEDARREQVAGRDAFRRSEDVRRGRRM